MRDVMTMPRAFYRVIPLLSKHRAFQSEPRRKFRGIRLRVRRLADRSKKTANRVVGLFDIQVDK